MSASATTTTAAAALQQEPKKENLNFMRRVVLGGIAGIIGATSVFPMDVVKTRLQGQRPLPDGTMPYKGVGDAFAKLYRGNHGFFGMYNGLIAQLVGITPEKAIKLAANDMFRYYLPKNAHGELDLVYEVVAGAGAGLTQVVATNPMEIVKIRMQVTKRTASEVPAFKSGRGAARGRGGKDGPGKVVMAGFARVTRLRLVRVAIAIADEGAHHVWVPGGAGVEGARIRRSVQGHLSDAAA